MKIFHYIVCILSLALSPTLLASAFHDLAEQNYWLKLIHYKASNFGSWESEVDDPQFFISPKGKTSPLDELTATVAAFNGENKNQQQTQEIRCRFPARYTWLQKNTKNQWPALNCLALSKWKKALNPLGITLVFPTAFMNSPSSMFGHTLLRVDAKDQNKHRELVAYAVNFAAQPNQQDNAATYAFKGIFGMYPGHFTVMPYYKKVREYNDIESRDIWEYKLNLSKKEVELILLHLWELQHASFDYYFIDENCSYQLLSLLQLANETLNLTASFSSHVIPSDTVAVLQKNKLLQKPNYRPAFGTRLHHYATQLSDDEMNAVSQLMSNTNVNISNHRPNRQVAILEMAYEWLNFTFNDKGLKRSDIAPRLNALLLRRSKIKINSIFTKPRVPSASPEQGHNSSRVGVYATNNSHDNDRAALSYRLAYHDLLDNPVGFIPGAQISFLDVATSTNDKGNTRIEHLYLIDAMSLASDNRVFDSWSWNMRLGFDRQPDVNKLSGRIYSQSGYGKSFGDPTKVHGYILGSIEFNGGDITPNINAGLGSELGVMWQINNKHKLALSGNVMRLIDSNTTYHSQLNVKWNWVLNKDWALRSSVAYKKWNRENTQTQLTLYHYF